MPHPVHISTNAIAGCPALVSAFPSRRSHVLGFWVGAPGFGWEPAHSCVGEAFKPRKRAHSSFSPALAAGFQIGKPPGAKAQNLLCDCLFATLKRCSPHECGGSHL